MRRRRRRKANFSLMDEEISSSTFYFGKKNTKKSIHRLVDGGYAHLFALQRKKRDFTSFSAVSQSSSSRKVVGKWNLTKHWVEWIDVVDGGKEEKANPSEGVQLLRRSLKGFAVSTFCWWNSRKMLKREQLSDEAEIEGRKEWNNRFTASSIVLFAVPFDSNEFFVVYKWKTWRGD